MRPRRSVAGIGTLMLLAAVLARWPEDPGDALGTGIPTPVAVCRNPDVVSQFRLRVASVSVFRVRVGAKDAGGEGSTRRPVGCLGWGARAGILCR